MGLAKWKKMCLIRHDAVYWTCGAYALLERQVGPGRIGSGGDFATTIRSALFSSVIVEILFKARALWARAWLTYIVPSWLPDECCNQPLARRRLVDEASWNLSISPPLRAALHTATARRCFAPGRAGHGRDGPPTRPEKKGESSLIENIIDSRQADHALGSPSEGILSPHRAAPFRSCLLPKRAPLPPPFYSDLPFLFSFSVSPTPWRDALCLCFAYISCDDAPLTEYEK